MDTLRYILFVACAALVSVKNGDGATFNLGVLIPWTVDWELGQYMGSAVGVGLQEVQDRGLLTGHAVNWQWKDTMCQPLAGIQAALDLFDEMGSMHAYIGGGCSSVCEPVALTAAARNVPFVSFGCNSQMLSDKTMFPTFTRSVGTWLSLAPMVDELMTMFGWEKLAILNTHDHIMQETADAIKFVIESRRGDGSVIEKAISSTHDNDTRVPAEIENQREALRSMKSQARIFLILMNDNDIHSALLSAYDEGMMDGEYVFITLEASLSERVSPDWRPQKSMEVYHGVISANLHKPSGAEWDAFAQDVIDEFQTETKFNSFTKLPAGAATSEVDVHAGFLHDAILMWAYAMNMSLAAGGDGTNGIDVNTRIINNVEFDGITGQVQITASGNRKADYTISIAQDGQWTDMLRWDAVNENLVKLYQPVSGDGASHDWEGIWWSGNVSTVPKGAPACGWNYENCQGLSGGEKAGISVSVVLLVIVASVLIIGYLFRRKKFETELMDFSTWKVNWSELTSNRLVEQIASSRATLKTNKTYGGLVKDGGNRPEVVDYKGRTVTVKRLNLKVSIDLEDRNILLDVKKLREVKHDNLNMFVGACTDAPNIAIFWEYASKGSVQDIIKNTAINLSWDFKLSIANDIAQGMAYLHNSPIEFHGNLNSHNCVVNSRWVCKVTDYGLHTIKKDAGPRIRCNTVEGADKLWTAPEVLRDTTLAGSAKGDVYSYAMILQELILRDGPFCCNISQSQLQPIDVIEKVNQSVSPAFRPALPQGCCSDSWRSLVIRCWAEDPLARPDFKHIKDILKELNGGNSIDVIENIIKMMEQQSEHLEELVAVKSSAAAREKEKVITLLNNLIPRSIAEQLGRGDEVHPEHFDNATIFMSDITGFSSLKSQSTPDQMVEILNSISQAFMEMMETYDITRVDAVGEQCVMVSGVPQRNGDNHVTEIATMALDMVNAAATFNIRHMPGTSLQLRVAMHTGPVVSCIVGLSTPRFYLYGDAMDTVSSLQSTSMSLRILVSDTSAALLEKAGGYKLECRGVTPIKGQGEMTTFWLLEKEGFKKVPDMFKANQ